jgi:hypothetical protein
MSAETHLVRVEITLEITLERVVITRVSVKVTLRVELQFACIIHFSVGIADQK